MFSPSIVREFPSERVVYQHASYPNNHNPQMLLLSQLGVMVLLDFFLMTKLVLYMHKARTGIKRQVGVAFNGFSFHVAHRTMINSARTR